MHDSDNRTTSGRKWSKSDWGGTTELCGVDAVTWNYCSSLCQVSRLDKRWWHEEWLRIWAECAGLWIMSLKSQDFVSHGLLWKSEFDSKYEKNLDKATDNVCDWVRLFVNKNGILRSKVYDAPTSIINDNMAKAHRSCSKNSRQRYMTNWSNNSLTIAIPRDVLPMQTVKLRRRGSKRWLSHNVHLWLRRVWSNRRKTTTMRKRLIRFQWWQMVPLWKLKPNVHNWTSLLLSSVFIPRCRWFESR